MACGLRIGIYIQQAAWEKQWIASHAATFSFTPRFSEVKVDDNESRNRFNGFDLEAVKTAKIRYSPPKRHLA